MKNIRDLPPRQKKIFFWTVILIIFIILFYFYIQGVQNRVKVFKEKYQKSGWGIQGPQFQRVETPALPEEEIKKLEENIEELNKEAEEQGQNQNPEEDQSSQNNNLENK